MDEDVQWEFGADIKYPETIESIHKVYSKWAPTYEEDMKKGHDVSNQSMVKASICFIENKESSLMLDIGTGPGTTARLYKEAGFKGQIDGIDLVQDMLDIARSKRIYRRLVLHGVTEHNPLPFDDGTYDVVVAGSSLVSNHLPAKSLLNILNVLKPGGLLIYNSRLSKGNEQYLEVLTKYGEELEEKKKIELLKKEEIPYNENINNAYVFIYKKL